MAKLINVGDGETWTCDMVTQDAGNGDISIGFIVYGHMDGEDYNLAELTVENPLEIGAFFDEVRDLEVRFNRAKAEAKERAASASSVHDPRD